jgi:hypothetical protein
MPLPIQSRSCVNSATLDRTPSHAADTMMWRSAVKEAVMEHLIFVCPTTRREVDSGVETEIGTLLRIRQENVRALCPACGKWHEWQVRDAFLAGAA